MPPALETNTTLESKFPPIKKYIKTFKNKVLFWDFPGGPVAKTLHYQCRRPQFDSYSGNKIPHPTTKCSYPAAETQHSQINNNKYSEKKKRSVFTHACVNAKLPQSCPTVCDPMNYSPPGSSVLVSRQEYS